MKISILTPDLSHNCLGRAYLLAKVLQRHYEVEIAGPVFGDGIWEPLANDKSIKYKSVKIHGKYKPYWQIKKLAKKIDGDVIYASKPLFASFGIGLLKKFTDKKPLVLDIDDWQMGFMGGNEKNRMSVRRFKYLAHRMSARRFKYLAHSALQLYSIESYWNNLFGEKLSHYANQITVSNNYLKDKFGGILICHGRDTEAFNPSKVDKDLIRDKYQIEKTKKVVMFFGTPRPYKGIDDLISAINLIKDQDVLLVIVGVNYKDPYCLNLVKTAKKVLGRNFISFGLQSFEKVPELLAMTDIVVIPQKNNSATIGQSPAKVFDAMAMAKPIIATNVSDLPENLDGCGWIVEAESPKQLAETIEYVLCNPGEANSMGRKARQKCIDKYSWDAMEKVLVEVFRRYE